jgi:Transaldolase/Fructose-6-phosphate aldolase
LQDLTRAADLFAAVHESTAGVDGFVSLELSPLLAYDTKKSVAAAKLLHGKGNRPNLFIKIPGTSEGVPAIEESIANGMAINVTLLFSREQYLASAEAYMRGLERRVSAGLSPEGPASGPRRKSSGEAAGCWRQNRRRNSGPFLYGVPAASVQKFTLRESAHL